MTEPGTTLVDLIHQRTADLTPAERRVARTLFASNLIAGFDTVAGLAARSKVSGPTIVRFTNKIGFAGYAEFQRALERDVAARIDSPLRLFGRRAPDQRGDHFLDVAGTSFVEGLKLTFASLSRADFDAVVALLADTRRTISTSGGSLTQTCAELLYAHLYQLRPKTRLIAFTPSGRTDALLDLSRADVFVIFDLRRYQKDTIALADAARKRGAMIVLVTDPWLSPIADLASHVLTVDVEAPSPYDSIVPCIALIEALVAGVVDRLGDTSRHRISALERLREGYTRDDRELPQRPGDPET